MNIIFCSCGNDSVATIEWIAQNKPLEQNVVIYSNTGWAAPFWNDRVNKVKAYVLSIGMSWLETKSEGMIPMVKRKKGWPMPASPMQFCTDILKVQPAIKLMTEIDPEIEADCYTGIRREESQNRAAAPDFIEQSERHGGRDLYCPLVEYTAAQRDELIKKTPLEILPHQSMECFPCINSNRSDFRMLADYPERIELIAKTEEEMGFTKHGKPRVMFRPYRHMKATGIHEVVRWALHSKGKYTPEDEGQISYLRCTSGFCNL